MLTIARQQVDALHQFQLDPFIADAETFLRTHFETRLRACSSADVRDAVFLSIKVGREYHLNRRGDLLVYLACACVCGLFLFNDPRCLWLFDETPLPKAVEGEINFNIDTLAQNLDTPPGMELFDEDPFKDFPENVLAAEQPPPARA